MSRPSRHPSRSETQTLVEEIAEEACLGLFEAYGVSLMRVDPNAKPDAPMLLSSVVGFSGTGVRGACVLAASEKPIEVSNPVGGSPDDWFGELGNQLVGRIRNRMSARGADVFPTLPVVLQGDHVAALPGKDVTFLVFRAAGGGVVVWMQLTTTDDFMLGPPIDVVAEGETMLF